MYLLLTARTELLYILFFWIFGSLAFLVIERWLVCFCLSNQARTDLRTELKQRSKYSKLLVKQMPTPRSCKTALLSLHWLGTLLVSRDLNSVWQVIYLAKNGPIWALFVTSRLLRHSLRLNSVCDRWRIFVLHVGRVDMINWKCLWDGMVHQAFLRRVIASLLHQKFLQHLTGICTPASFWLFLFLLILTEKSGRCMLLTPNNIST